MAKTYIIDIGHANNTGSRSLEKDRSKQDEEHDLCTKIAAKLYKILTDQGNKVTLLDFPTLDNSADLNKTIQEANKRTADLGISIHMDWASTESPKGGHVIYYSSSGKKYADKIAPKLASLLPGRADIVQYGSFGVLRLTKWPWVIVECGFISNPHDRALAKEHPEKIAEAIASALK